MIAAYLLTPVSSRLASRLGALDRTTGLPRAGGAAVFLAAALALATLGLLFEPTANLLRLARQELGAAGIGLLALLALGVWDDIRGLGAKVKLTSEIVIASALWWAGIRISTLWLPGGIVELGPWAGYAFTVLWIVGIANAFNLLDGIDGAAAGAAVFALLAMFVTSVNLQQPLVALILVALAGGTLGFLPFNFPPARVYLGDAGSLSLGYCLAVLAIEGATKGPAIVAIAIPIVAFGLPVLDTLVAIVRRLARGAPVFQGDREHLHHRLLNLGLSKAQAAVVLYAASAAFALASMLFLNPNVRGLAVVLTMVGLVVWLAVRYLRLHEFYELARLASRGVQQTRAIGFNVKVRTAADALERAESWADIQRLLAALFSESEFDGVRLTVQRDGEPRREYRLEGDEFKRESKLIQSDEWGIHIPFGIGPRGALNGELAVFRRYGRRPLLTDTNLLVEVLRPALARAASRVAPPPD